MRIAVVQQKDFVLPDMYMSFLIATANKNGQCFFESRMLWSCDINLSMLLSLIRLIAFDPRYRQTAMTDGSVMITTLPSARIVKSANRHQRYCENGLHFGPYCIWASKNLLQCNDNYYDQIFNNLRREGVSYKLQMPAAFLEKTLYCVTYHPRLVHEIVDRV